MVRAIAYGGGTYIANYHWGYQTFDGRWANKHGKKPSKLLPDYETPFSTDTSGWDYDDAINFYDGIIYSYIITVS